MTVDKEGNNPTTLSVDEQIDEILEKNSCNVTDYLSGLCINDIKSLIKEVCEEVIGQNMPTGKNASKHRFQNTLRDEQRTKLNKILGEGK